MRLLKKNATCVQSPRIVLFAPSRRAFIGMLVKHICSSNSLFMSVSDLRCERIDSGVCLGVAHKECNKLLWSETTMWRTIP